MPTYDYLCDECGYKFEHFQSMTSSILKKCPKCGKMQLRRLIGAGSGVIFKGSGFYETDYRSDNYKSAAKTASSVTTDSCKNCKEKKECKKEGESTPKTTESKTKTA